MILIIIRSIVFAFALTYSIRFGIELFNKAKGKHHVKASFKTYLTIAAWTLLYLINQI